MNWTRTMLSSRLQTGQEKVLEGVEMASPSYFTLSLHYERSCLCSAPAQHHRLSSSSSSPSFSSSSPCPHALLLMDELICCKSLSSQTGTLLLPLCYISGHRGLRSQHINTVCAHRNAHRKRMFQTVNMCLKV